MRNLCLLTTALIALIACEPHVAIPGDSDSQISDVTSVVASAVTTPTIGDGANDPALWLRSDDPETGLILGTDSERGIEFYSLDGQRIGEFGGRPISLVDVRDGVDLGNGALVLVVAYDTETSELVAYELDPDVPGLTEISNKPLPMNAEIEGLCTYRSPLSGKLYVFAVGEGVVRQWELVGRDGMAGAVHTRDVPVGHGAGHCVAHDRDFAIYFGQEGVGVMRLNAEPESEAQKTMVDAVQPFGRFAGDIKGVAVTGTGNRQQLIVSDADESRFQIYDLPSQEFIGTFVIDGVEESEGITAASDLIIVTDDDNDGEHTNYRIVPRQNIAEPLGLPDGAGGDETRRTYVTVKPSVETEPVASFGDAADDPAIWVHPDQPELSLIIAAQKKRGINVYDLEGNLLQSRPDGRINNVDLRYGFPLAGESVALIAGSNRTSDSISLWAVNSATRNLRDVADGTIDTGMIDPYGVCMYREKASGNYYVFVNDTDGVVRQWRLFDNGNGRVAAERVREFRVASQTEGCVADDESGSLFIGEEDVGIWKYQAAPDAGDDATLIDGVGENGNLTADVEGLAIYRGSNGAGYLVASNQGADSYALYELDGDHQFIGIFHVVANEALGIDGISETDGLEVTGAYLGSAYPDGIFVAQDGRNISPDDRQNFKLVSWQAIADAMGLDAPATD